MKIQVKTLIVFALLTCLITVSLGAVAFTPSFGKSEPIVPDYMLDAILTLQEGIDDLQKGTYRNWFFDGTPLPAVVLRVLSVDGTKVSLLLDGGGMATYLDMEYSATYQQMVIQSVVHTDGCTCNIDPILEYDRQKEVMSFVYSQYTRKK